MNFILVIQENIFQNTSSSSPLANPKITPPLFLKGEGRERGLAGILIYSSTNLFAIDK
jgi:hypothetical protein